MKISSVVKRTGVPKETIHFYIREGLLRKPHKSGINIADYNENHVKQIRFIKELRDNYYFPIPLIRKIMRKVKKQPASDRAFFELHSKYFRPADRMLTGEIVGKEAFHETTGLGRKWIDKAEQWGLIEPHMQDGRAVYSLDDVAVVERAGRPIGEVADRLQALLERTGFRSDGIFVMDGSRRSSHGNAYFTGFGRTKRIVFFDTLLKQLSPAQVEAVLAHELGHFKRRHILKGMLLSLGMSFVGFALLAWLMQQQWFFSGLGVSEPSSHMALMLFVLVSPVFTFLLGPLMARLSRRHEFEADAFAAEQSDAESLISALVALYRENASTLTPDPLYSAFHDTHPPASIRIAHLKRLAHAG